MPETHLCSSPARLHFGLLTVGNSLEYRYGGAGLMIDGPNTVVEVRHTDRLEVLGASSEVTLRTIEHWYSKNQTMLATDFAVHQLAELPLRIEVLQTPPRHSGFGSGTQLAFSVITATMQCLGLPIPSAKELAVATGRGQRSAIGSHGFRRGGFLVDRGIASDPGIAGDSGIAGDRVIAGDQETASGQQLAPLDLRIDFPTDWPIVTVVPRGAQGVSGSDEKAAFKNLAPSTPQHRQRMTELLKTTIVPAVMTQNYDSFAAGIFEYGHRSGRMFEAIQGGPYNGPTIERVVNLVREFGVTATGQSSWGPCVFAVLSTKNQAEKLVAFLNQRVPADTQIDTWTADNRGMRLTTKNTEITTPSNSRKPSPEAT